MSGVASIYSVAPIGFEGSLIEVESDMKNGLPSLQVVGLGNKAIDEARERIRSAITNSLLDFPAKKIIINLAPAELPKDGSHYDLAMALYRDKKVSDDVYRAAQQKFGERGIMDIIGLIGYYDLVSMTLITMQAEAPNDSVPPLPPLAAK